MEINQNLSKCLMEVTSVTQLLQCLEFLLCTAMIQALSVHASSLGSVEGSSTFSDHKLMPKLKNVGLTG